MFQLVRLIKMGSDETLEDYVCINNVSLFICSAQVSTTRFVYFFVVAHITRQVGSHY